MRSSASTTVAGLGTETRHCGLSSRETPPRLICAARWNHLRHRDPPELFGEAGQQLKIPIELPVGKEYKAICDAVFARLEEIAQLIAP